MSKFLLTEEKKFRVDSEEEAQALIEEYKDCPSGDLVSYTSTKKTTKEDEYFIVKVKLLCNDEKNPV